MAAASSYPFVFPRHVLLGGVPFGGGLVLCFRVFALGVGVDVILTKPEKALEVVFWLILVGSMTFDLFGNYWLKREMRTNRDAHQRS